MTYVTHSQEKSPQSRVGARVTPPGENKRDETRVGNLISIEHETMLVWFGRRMKEGWIRSQRSVAAMHPRGGEAADWSRGD